MPKFDVIWKPKGIVKIEGLAREELEGALVDMGTELATPKGTGRGVQVNSLSFEVKSGMAEVESSLVFPRTTGEAWLARSLSDAESMAEEVLQSAAKGIVEGVGN